MPIIRHCKNKGRENKGFESGQKPQIGGQKDTSHRKSSLLRPTKDCMEGIKQRFHHNPPLPHADEKRIKLGGREF